ncbi:MAG: hypothetical protein ABIR80_07035 [Opitutaceae bacterium]
MKALIGTMALCVLGCAVLVAPSLGEILRGFFVPTIPPGGGGAQVLSLLGGIGGSVTMMCYGYWMRLEGWRGGEKLPTVRGDVGFAYFFTGLFGAALMVINNRRDWMGELANRWLGNAVLVVCLLVFGAVCVREVVAVLS